MDGLPGMKRALVAAKTEGVAPIKKMIGPFAPEQMRRLRAQSYALEHVILVALVFFMLGIGAVLYGEMVAEKMVMAFPVLRKADTIPWDTIPLLRHMVNTWMGRRGGYQELFYEDIRVHVCYDDSDGTNTKIVLPTTNPIARQWNEKQSGGVNDR